MLSIPGYSQLIYNYRTDVWATVDTAEDIQAIGDFFDTDLAQNMSVADDDGHVYHFHDTAYGYDDSSATLGAAISSSFISRPFGGEAATKHFVERVSLLCDQYTESITLAMLSEGTSLKSRTVSLDYDPRWKVYSLSTRHAAKSQTQLQVTYTGATAIELEGFAVDAQPLNRPTMMAR